MQGGGKRRVGPVGKIHLLAPEVVDKIAAGEVIERPASVVKELIENSLDAGARRIEVEVQGGSLDLIRVTDDGEGIGREDLPLALARHATSKLKREEELWSVRTLGFRGEALASIAAVSRIELISRVRGAEEGWRICAEGGKAGNVEPAGSPPGTTVVVRDLFFNAPVRRKFMQRPPVEAGRIASVVTAYALAQSEVAFRLLQEGHQLIVTPGSGRLLEAVAALQGPEVVRDLVPVSWEAEGVAVAGYVGLPRLHRANRWQEWIFVNGRAIESPLLTHALEEAYRTLLPPRRFPVAILHCQLDPAAVDVNVHPAKREVRFYRAQAVHRAVYGAVTAALGRERSRGVVGEPREEGPSSAGWLDEPKEGPPSAGWLGETEAKGGEEGGAIGERSPTWSTSPPSALVHSLSLPAWTPSAGGLVAVPPFRLVGQVRGTFLVCEGKEGLVLIDQHAAHERVLYDQLCQTWQKEGRLAAQPLLLPVTLTLSPVEAQILSAHREELERWGLVVEEFGPRAYLIRALPLPVAREGGAVDAAALVRDLLLDLEEEGWAKAVGEGVSAHQLQLLACRGAIKAGQVLQPEEAEALLQRLWRTASPWTCAHGRPTALYLSWTELERRFLRQEGKKTE